METPLGTIYVDPVDGADSYADMPAALQANATQFANGESSA